MLIATRAWAQAGADSTSEGMFRVGPMRITPAITVSSGVDTNVFNQAVAPRSDITTTVIPRVQVTARLRRLSVELRNVTDAVHFQTYSAQGGLSTRNEVKGELPLNRLRLSLGHSFGTVNQRASIELDARVRRRETALNAGLDLRAASKTILRVNATRATTRYDDTSLLGASLSTTLDRTAESAGASLRYAISALTTVSVAGDAMRETFPLSPERDSASVRVGPAIEFLPRAVMSGRAFVGYRSFSIDSGIAPDYAGAVASIELSSVIRGETRVAVQAERDLAYSFDPFTPYYVLTGAGASVARRIAERWDAALHATHQRLDYRSRVDIAGATANRVERSDWVRVYGVGLNYRFRRDVRFGITAFHTNRHSDLEVRGFRGTRILGQFTYGS